MAYESLKQEIRQYIKTNGQNEITGQILQDVLVDMVNQYPSLDGYATQQWVENQGYISEADLTNYATQSWVGQNFLSLSGDIWSSGAINKTAKVTAENGLQYLYGDSMTDKSTTIIDDTITLSSTVDILGTTTSHTTVISSSGITIDGNSVWHAGNLNPSNYMLSSTAVINSVVGDELGHLTLTGPNFSATVLDFSHQHRFEELVDVPTTIQDYGITDAYISNGTIYLGGNSITPITSLTGYATESWVTQNFIFAGINLHDSTVSSAFSLVWGSSYQYYTGIDFGNDSTDGVYIQMYSRGGQLQGTKILMDSVTSDKFVIPNGTSSQFLKADGSVDSNTYITSSALSDYATKDWVGQNFLSLSGDIWSSGAINKTAKVTAENGLQYLYGDSMTDKSTTIIDDTITLSSTVDILGTTTSHTTVISSSGITIDGNSVWHAGNLNPSNYMLSSTAVINSVVGDELGHLTLTGPNFSATVLDFSHQHRFEELVDVPTTIQDYGITDAYISNGTIYLGGNSITPITSLTGYATESWVTQNFIFAGINLHDSTVSSAFSLVWGSSYQYYTGIDFGNDSTDGVYIQMYSRGGQLQGTKILMDSVTSDKFVIPNGTSSQFLKADGSVDSNTYATQSTVNGLSYINGVALNGDGSLSLTGHSFTTTILDMTHQHRWEELTDRPLIDMWNDTMVAVNGIVSSGKIGAGVSATPSYMLEVNGQSMLYYEVGIGTAPTSGISLDIDGTARAGSFVNNSDIRKKDVVEYDVDPGFETIANAPTIRFTWKDRGLLDNRGECVGSIAQYWQLALPEAVMTDSEGYLSMQYDVIALIAAVSVAKRVASHEQRIAALERENALLRMDIKALKGEA